MDRQFAEWRYNSLSIENHKEGYVGLSLHRSKNENSELAARIIYWDAAGHFFLEMQAPEIPLSVIEEFIDEARRTIKIK